MNKRLFTVIASCALLIAAFAGCELDSGTTAEQAALTLSASSLNITSAVATVTSRTLTAKTVHTDASVVWSSSNTSVAALSASSGSETTVVVQGAGTANICAATSDGTITAICKVTVTLGQVSSHPISGFAVSGSPTVDTIDVSWTEASDATGSKFVCIETATGTVVSTKYFSKGTSSASFTDLNQNTSYTFNGYGVINPQTSSEGVSDAASCVIMTAADITAPSSVTDAAVSTSSDHSVTLTWTDPSDSDYTNVVITASAADLKGKTISQEVAKGSGTVTLSPLAANSSYTFTIATKDKFGNIQGDANNTSNTAATVKTTTSADTTSPSAVSAVSVTVNSITSITLSWTDPSDADAKNIVISATTSTTGITAPDDVTVLAGTKTATITVSAGANYTFTLKAQDYDGNKSSGVAADASTEPLASNVAATASSTYTGRVTLTWTDATAVENGETYTYTVTATPASTANSETTVTYGNISVGTQKYVFDGLVYGTSYTFTVTTVKTSTGTTYLSKSTASAEPLLLTMKIFNISTQSYMVASSTTSIITSSSDSSNYSRTWIIRPALDGTSTYTYSGDSNATGTKNTFSLEAIDASGKATGSYLYFTTLSSGTGCLVTKANATTPSYGSWIMAAWANNSSPTKPTGAGSIMNLRFVNNGTYEFGSNNGGAIAIRSSAGAAGNTVWCWCPVDETSDL